MFRRRLPYNNLEYSKRRLEIILNRRRLLFNPYTVSDSRLLEIANTTDWGCQYDITEFVTFHFTRLEAVKDWRNFKGIYVKIGYSDSEVFINKGTLMDGVAATDTLRRERTLAGKKPIRSEKDIEKPAWQILLCQPHH